MSKLPSIEMSMVFYAPSSCTVIHTDLGSFINNAFQNVDNRHTYLLWWHTYIGICYCIFEGITIFGMISFL